MTPWEPLKICATLEKSVIQLPQEEENSEQGREDVSAFPTHIPNVVGLEMHALVYFALSHPCV